MALLSVFQSEWSGGQRHRGSAGISKALESLEGARGCRRADVLQLLGAVSCRVR